MKAAPETGGEASAWLAHLESILQKLSRCEEHANLQSVEHTSVITKQRLLSSQLRQAQDEVAAAQASKAKLCEQIGTLQQTKEYQAKQLAKYKLDLQASRDTQATMIKRMEELESSTWSTKQHYIRSLATRMKTTAQLLHQLHLTNGTSLVPQLTEKCSEWGDSAPNKRKRVAVENGHQQDEEVGGKPELTDITSESEPQSCEMEASRSTKRPTVSAVSMVVDLVKEAPNTANHGKNEEEQEENRAQCELAVEQMKAQVVQLNAEHLALQEKHQALERDHAVLLTASKTSAHAIEAKDTQIEELMKQLELARSKPDVATVEPKESLAPDHDNSELQGRLKVLEDNLAQMNGYADQLEVVIAQCPSCTIKLQNECTQDSVTGNKAE